MITAVIIDNEIHIRELLQQLLHEYCPTVTVIATAESLASGKQLLLTTQPDVVFLDVELGDGTGMELLQGLPNTPFSVIFITAYNKYAVDAFTCSAIDFLLKPFDIDALQRSVARAESVQKTTLQLEQLAVLTEHTTPTVENKRLVLRDAQTIHYVQVSNILYCEAKGAYTEVVVSNQPPIVVSRNLKEYETILEYFKFMRVHNSYLVNPQHVVRYEKKDGGFLVLSNDANIPVSQRRKDEVLKGLGNL